ncbi:MAG: hypothetical protein ACKO3W_14325 [bacterium]
MKLAVVSSIAALVIVGTQAANAQQCAGLDTTGFEPLQGLASFSALVTTTFSGSYACAAGIPPCEYTCQSLVNEFGGRVYMKFCPTWVPNWGDWCWSSSASTFQWVNREGSNGGNKLEIPSLQHKYFIWSNSVSATLTFSQPVKQTPSYGVAITGGHVVSSGAQNERYFDAGDSAQVDSTGGEFGYVLCTDQDANGRCDTYDTVARAFGDFDGSGAVDGGDLAFLLGQWGASGPLGDLDGSGIVGGGDLAILLGRWGQEV